MIDLEDLNKKAENLKELAKKQYEAFKKTNAEIKQSSKTLNEGSQ